MSVYWHGFAFVIAAAAIATVFFLLVEMHRRRKHRAAMLKGQRIEMRRQNRFRKAMLAQQRTEMLRLRSFRKTILALTQTANGSLGKLALQGAATNQQLEMLVSCFQGGPVEPGVDTGGPPPPADSSSSRPPPGAPPKQKGDDPIDDVLERASVGLFDKHRTEEACSLWYLNVIWYILRGKGDGMPPAAAELGSSLYVAGPSSGAHESDGSSKMPPLAAAPSRPQRGQELLRHEEPTKSLPMQTELERLCLKYRITAECVYGAAEPWPDEWTGRQCHPWTVTLSWRGAEGKSKKPITITVSFFQGAVHENEPTAADVLSSLLVDAAVEDYSSFEEWAADLGYNPDSRKAWGTYQGCLMMAARVRAFCGQDEEVFAELRDAEH